jgi:naphthoate synthase/2-ketocyclohexanecarboxyl-CoA hydrolase
MAGTYEDITYEVADGVARITIDRPHVHNAFRLETLGELLDAFRAAETDREVGVIVLTGAGERAFSSGGDVKMEDDSDPATARRLARLSVELAMVMRGCGKPVIARVRGWAIGGGNELHLLCDFTIASDDSRFGQVGPTMGSVPVWWGTQLLPRLVGEKRAREVVMLCRRYSAAQALEMGWINSVVPPEELDAEVQRWCDELLRMSPQSLRVAKLSLNYESDHLWSSVLHGFEMISFIHGTEEFHEGTSAFLEKRPPAFSQYRT